MRDLNTIIADINRIEAAISDPSSKGVRTILKAAHRKLATEYRRALAVKG